MLIMFFSEFRLRVSGLRFEIFRVRRPRFGVRVVGLGVFGFTIFRGFRVYGFSSLCFFYFLSQILSSKCLIF